MFPLYTVANKDLETAEHIKAQCFSKTGWTGNQAGPVSVVTDVFDKLCFIHIVIVLCSDLRKICYTKWQLLRDDTTHRLLMFHT